MVSLDTNKPERGEDREGAWDEMDDSEWGWMRVAGWKVRVEGPCAYVR